MHAVSMGLHAHSENNGGAKLANSQVIEIRQKLSIGDRSQSDIAREYGVSKHAIHKIARGKNWLSLAS